MIKPDHKDKIESNLNKGADSKHTCKRIENMFAVHNENRTMIAIKEALVKLAEEGLLNE